MTEGGIDLPYSPDLAETGVQEVLRSLAHPARHLFFHNFDAMRMRVANNIVSLAFRRYLAEKVVPHQFSEPISFIEADHYDLVIGGRRCIPTALLVCGDQVNEQVAYLPDQHGGSIYRDVDIYLFFTLSARVTRSRDETDEFLFSGRRACLIHQMPEIWASPEHWDGIGRLAIKTDSSKKINLTLHGLDQYRAYSSYSLEAQPRKRTVVETGLFAIGALSAESYPTGPVGVFNPVLDDLHLIHPHTWGNIWVYGQAITGLGYITKGAFDQQAKQITGPEMEGANPCLGEEDYFYVPLESLTPLEGLFQRAREWKAD